MKTQKYKWGDNEWEVYKTDLKVLGKVVFVFGLIFLSIAMFPNGLGLIFYPLSSMCFGLIGINVFVEKAKLKKKLIKKYRYAKMRYI